MGDALTPTRAVVMAEASASAGRGHLARCGALAAAFERDGVEVVRVALGASASVEHDGAEWVAAGGQLDLETTIAVVDSYEPQPGMFEAVARSGACVVRFDDGMGLDGPADLIVEPLSAAPGAERPDATRLQGPRYACLGRAYWEVPERDRSGEVAYVLVTAGGSAPADLIERLQRAVASALPGARLEVGAGVESLRDRILAADLVVCAAGQTMLEVCACGAPCIALPIADNQRAGAEALEALGCVRLAGGPEEVSATARDLAADPAARAALGHRGRELVDGKGALRVAKSAQSLAAEAAGR